MERQRKREKRPRLRIQSDNSEQPGHEVNRVPPLEMSTIAERPLSVPSYTSPNGLHVSPDGPSQTSLSPVGPSLAPVPQLPLSSTVYGNSGSYNDGHMNMMGGLASSHNYGLNYWKYEGHTIPNHFSIAPAVHYHSPTTSHIQGHGAPSQAFAFPNSPPHPQHHMVPIMPYGSLPVLPPDGALLRILVKSTGLSTTARLDLRYETSFIQPREVKAQSLKPYRIPEAKRRFYTLPQGAQSPKAFVRISLDIVDFAFKNLDLFVQISLDDHADAPMRLGKGFLRKALISCGYDATLLHQLLPLGQCPPNQVQSITAPAPVCFDGFPGILPFRPFQITPSSFIAPSYSMQNIVNPASIELEPSYDSISPSLQPSRHSWEVETLSSVTTPLDTSISWDEFNAINTPMDLTEQPCADPQNTSTSAAGTTPQPPAVTDFNTAYNH